MKTRLFRTGVLVLLAVALVTSAAAQNKDSDDNDFHGFYFGGYAGGSLGRSEPQTTTIFSPTGYFAASSVPAIAAAGHQKLEPTGFAGGGTVGINWQWSRKVFGFEADFGGLSSDDAASTTAPYPCCPTTGFTITQTVSSSWGWTLRPRLGYTFGRMMPYITGGIAGTNFEYRSVFTDTFASATENGGGDEHQVGWTVGGGLEFKMSRHWNLKGEYLYSDFGEITKFSSNLQRNTPAVVTFPSNTFTHQADLQTHQVRFGVNYRF